jgi:site-specific DNA-methyltransferase (cytosine-N4-specific)
MIPIYKTDFGTYYCGKVEELLKSNELSNLYGKVSLIFTSPPFPLIRSKKYGNFEGVEYIEWISSIANPLKKFLKEDGSLVIEIGNSWDKGLPTMSVLPIKALLAFLEAGNYQLCQQFIWNNTAKLPSPIQWVNIKRIRAKDAFTNIWWMSPTSNPKADNRKVLKEYSSSMKSLLKNQRYNPGLRPSEHTIGETSFLADNNGSIPSNVLEAANTNNDIDYLGYCKHQNVKPHPARMPKDIASFFIKFLTDEGDIVMDPFGGSNITGFVAENLKRQWVSIDRDVDYINGSRGRFQALNVVSL